MIHFDLSTHIHRPLIQVFAFVTTPENDFQWQYGTLTSAQVSRGVIGKGTLFRTVGHVLGRRTETVYEVTVFGIGEFKKASNELRSTLEEEIRIEEQREQQKPAQPAPTAAASAPQASEPDDDTVSRTTGTGA